MTAITTTSTRKVRCAACSAPVALDTFQAAWDTKKPAKCPACPRIWSPTECGSLLFRLGVIELYKGFPLTVPVIPKGRRKKSKALHKRRKRNR